MPHVYDNNLNTKAGWEDIFFKELFKRYPEEQLKTIMKENGVHLDGIGVWEQIVR
jgi:hypothetical protein